MSYGTKSHLKSPTQAATNTSTVIQPKSLSLIDKYKDDRHFVTALARGLEVLACFRSGNRVLGNQDIAKRCNLSNSTVSRLTSTLVKMGYLMHDAPSGKYRLGMATLSLGMGMLAKLDVRQIARPFLQEIADFSQGVVSLGVRDRLSMLCIETCRSRSALTLQLDVGTRLPITTSSMGRAYLAEAGQAELDEVFERVSELDERSSHLIRQGIEQALKDYQELGCTCSFGEWQGDVNGIAVGLNLGENFPIMSINCGGPSFSLSPEFLLDEVRPRLLAMTQSLKESFGVTDFNF